LVLAQSFKIFLRAIVTKTEAKKYLLSISFPFPAAVHNCYFFNQRISLQLHNFTNLQLYNNETLISILISIAVSFNFMV